MAKKILIIDDSSRGDEFLEFLKKFNSDEIYESGISYYEIQLQKTIFDLIICHIGPTTVWDLSSIAGLIKKIHTLKNKALLIAVSEGADFRDISKSSGANLVSRYGDLMKQIEKNTTRFLSPGDVLYNLSRISKGSEEKNIQKVNLEDVILDFHTLNREVDITKNKVFIVTDNKDSAIILEKVLSTNKRIITKILNDVGCLKSEIGNEKLSSTLIILDILTETAYKIRKWLWEGIRFNNKNLGKLAGAPVLVLSGERNFGENNLDEYFVFEKLPQYNFYLHKPFLLRDLTGAVNNLMPISIDDLSMIVVRYAPKNIKNGYFHILDKSDLLPENANDAKKEFKKRQAMLERIKSIKSTKTEIKRAENLLQEFEKNIIFRFGNILEVK